MPGIDEKDREILRILRKEGRITLTELGRKVNLSPASVRNRLEKLEKLGAVKGYSAVVDPAFLDKYVKVLFLLKLKVEGPDIDLILEKFAAYENVESIFRTSGRTHAVIIAEFEDMDEMKAFASRLRKALGNSLEYIEWSAIYDVFKECWIEVGKRGGRWT
ncbi:Lrp/AsnC family transcriptional regulator [Thermococcus zilligii]|uniref:Lrp/AsnC family transcriptional regulator n=1 Tax=Thermococcus zilligii TaxID=54076 RepID=UPI00029A610B|nr:Lrp/AsnC family transcriptional regulator [Thermococcus zilligii]